MENAMFDKNYCNKGKEHVINLSVNEIFKRKT